MYYLKTNILTSHRYLVKLNADWWENIIKTLCCCMSVKLPNRRNNVCSSLCIFIGRLCVCKLPIKMTNRGCEKVKEKQLVLHPAKRENCFPSFTKFRWKWDYKSLMKWASSILYFSWTSEPLTTSSQLFSTYVLKQTVKDSSRSAKEQNFLFRS